MATYGYRETSEQRGQPSFFCAVLDAFSDRLSKIVVSMLRTSCASRDGRTGPRPSRGGLSLTPWRRTDDGHQQEITDPARRAPTQSRRPVYLRTTATGLQRNMLRRASLVLGGLAFLAAHGVEVVWWTSWFAGAW